MYKGHDGTNDNDRPAVPEDMTTPEVGALEEPAGVSAFEVELQQQLEECRAQSSNYLDQWRRAGAEFSNYKKRVEREQSEFSKNANAALITRLLPIVDDMDTAFSNLPDGLKDQPWVEGMSLVHRKLHTIFEQEGVREIETVGKVFNPALHEAVTHEASTTVKEGEIIGEVRKGYRLNDRVLRVAVVRVSAGPSQCD
jgi:molecular chaperone GrpE